MWLVVSLNQRKLSSVTCADSVSQLNMKKTLNLGEEWANLSWLQSRVITTTEDKRVLRSCEYRGEASPSSSCGYQRSSREAKDEYLVRSSPHSYPQSTTRALRNTWYLSMPYLKITTIKVDGSHIWRWRSYRDACRNYSINTTKGTRCSALRAMGGRPRSLQGTAASRSGSLLSVLMDILKEQRMIPIVLEMQSSFVILTMMNILELRLFFIFWYFVPK